jgi:hypothetical protein
MEQEDYELLASESVDMRRPVSIWLLGHDSERRANCLSVDDRADHTRAVPVVLHVVGRSHRLGLIGPGLNERNVPLYSPGTDSTPPGFECLLEPTVGPPVGGSNVDRISASNSPDGHVRAETAVRAARGELQLGGSADSIELIFRPSGYRDPVAEAASYSASVTSSPQSASAPLAAASQMARWVMK